MKENKFLKILFILTLTVLFSSCSKNENNLDDLYTAEKEQALLNDYLDYLIEKGLDIDTTASGVYYVVFEEGDSITAQSGDKVSVVYIGYFIGGDPFDSSGDPEKYGYYTYTHKVDAMIKGWEDGIETIKKGGTSLLIVPSKLAYGSTGNYNIPPYTTLLYEIYVHDIESPLSE